MSTIVSTKMMSSKCILNIGNNVCRLLPNVSLLSNSKFHLSENSMIFAKQQNVRNISLSSALLKEVFQRTKPHLNIG